MTSFPSIHYLSPFLSFSVLSSPRTPPNPNPLSRLHYFRPSLVSLLFPSTPIRLYPFSLLPLFLSFPSLPFFPFLLTFFLSLLSFPSHSYCSPFLPFPFSLPSICLSPTFFSVFTLSCILLPLRMHF